MRTRLLLLISSTLLLLLAANIETWAFYNPAAGRWLNRDPIDELDAPNLYGFLRNRVNSTIDQDGRLTIEFVFHDGRECESDTVCWRYQVDAAGGAPCNGYFAQEVRIYTDQAGCCSLKPKTPIVPQTVFYEAFPVAFAGTSTSQPGPRGDTDCSFQGGGLFELSVGTYYVETDVKFFCQQPYGGTAGTGDLNRNPNWGRGLVTSPGRGTLQSRQRPSWWNSTPVEGPTRRWKLIEWDCCPIRVNLLPWEVSWAP